MQGLCRWALAIQEYDFNIIYRKGSLNSNADALSRQQPTTCAITVEWPQQSLVALRQSQETDSTISKVLHARLSKATAPHTQQWKTYPFRRYKQLWSQLHVIDGIVHPSPNDGASYHSSSSRKPSKRSYIP